MLKKLLYTLPLLVIASGVAAVLIVKDTSEELTVSQDLNFSESYVTLESYQASPELHQDKRVVYFFHAVWCPTCRALENDIRKNSGSLPSDLVIIKTDFDTENNLRQQFGVVTQHTLVQINSDGEILGKWVAQPSLASVLEDLQA